MPFRRACGRHVDYIDKRHCNLVAVPDEVLRHRATLEDLLLDANQIRDLPRGLYRLIELRKLTFSDNEISRISPDIGNLVNLEELDASSNDIEEIPENMKFCKNLQAVNFSSNPISKLPEGFTQLRGLVKLSLNDVCLNRLPSDFGSLCKLESLELRENLIKYLPSSLSKLLKLRIFDLGCNLIEELPSIIGSLPSLEELWLDGNKISTLPMELGKLKLLTQLDLSDNKLEELPEEIGGLTNLTDLLLSQNQLRRLPDAVGNLGNLAILKVDQNLLQTLTEEIGSCCSLQELILTENMLTVLPATIGKLLTLTNLNVDKNRLTEIPKEIGECAQLGVLSIRDNRLNSVPDEIGDLRRLHVLDVSGNRLRHLPVALGSCNLKAIWMSENQAKPMLNFQEDVNEENGEPVLTCFLLPQQSCRTESTEDLVLEDDAGDDDWNDHGRASAVGFMNVNDIDEVDDEGGESRFVRQNTPHPKELRTRHSKQFRKEIDGRTTPYDEQSPRDSVFFPGRDSDAREDGCALTDTTKPPLLKKSSNVKIHPSANFISDGEAADAVEEQLRVETTSEGTRETTESLESPLFSDEGNDDMEDDNEEVVVHHVGFVGAVDDVPEKEGKLRRRDTPHHLKNKRINPGLAKVDSEEKVRQILAQVAGSRSSGEDVVSKSFLVRQNSAMEETDGSREGDVESGVCDDVLSDDDAADELTKLLPASSAAAENDARSFGQSASFVASSNKVPDNVQQTRRDVVSNLAEVVVRVVREPATGLGISIAGGLGSMPYKAGDKGIFISRVTDDGPSSRAGLRVGDKLLSVNGRSLIGAEHKHAVAVLKEAGNEVVMVIGREVKANQKEMIFDWSSIESDVGHLSVNAETIVTTLRRNQSGFGFSIAGGRGSVPYRGGIMSIYISRIVEGSNADRDGKLEVGDWIVSINGQNVTNSRHDEVVKVLTKGDSDITLVVYREIPNSLNKPLQPPQSDPTLLASASASTAIPLHAPVLSCTAAVERLGVRDSCSLNDCVSSASNAAPAEPLLSSCYDSKDTISQTPGCVESSLDGALNISSVENTSAQTSSIVVDTVVVSHCITSSDMDESVRPDSSLAPSHPRTVDCAMAERRTSTPDALISEISNIGRQEDAVSDSSACTSSSVPVVLASSSLTSAPHSAAEFPAAKTLSSPTGFLPGTSSTVPFSADTAASARWPQGRYSPESEVPRANASPSDVPGAVVELFDALERSSFSSVYSCGQINSNNVHQCETKSVSNQAVAAQSALSLAENDPKGSGCCYPTETVVIVKAGGPLGLSIVGGLDHPSHPFGTGEPGIFISKIVSDGAAAKTSLRIGDRILSVNGKDISSASHMEAVNCLTTQSFEILLEVRHDPQPLGLQEIKLYKELGERLGISIRGGAKSKGGHPLDKTDEGIFISRIEPCGAIARDGRLKVGQRILEVNRQSLLGVTHQEAVEVLLGVTDKLVVLVCDGFDAALLHRQASGETADVEDFQLKPNHDEDLTKREIFAFNAKRKFFEKEIESALPSKTELGRNEMLESENNLSIQQSEFNLQPIISDNNAVNLTS